MTALCATLEDLASSVRAFANGDPEQQREALGNAPIYFVHLRDRDADKFGLSKFCAFADVPLADYREKEIYNEKNGNQTQKHIVALTGLSWTPLSSAPRQTRSAFMSWWNSLPRNGGLATAKFHVMTISSEAIDAGQPPGEGGRRKPSKMTPEQLAERLEAQAAVGAAGERIALKFERERLREARVRDPVKSATQTSLSNVSAGYDIHSDSAEGGLRCIEVKATVGSANDGFFISANELATLRDLGTRAYIYLVEVESLPSKGRVVAVIPNPARYLDEAGVLKPQHYRAPWCFPEKFRVSA